MKWSLKAHERTHTREKPFQCKTCPRRFAQLSGLKYHNQIHSGEKPFQCKTCLKPFAQKQILIDHEKIHSGDKPFHCKTCSKSFAQKSALKVHERNHTGEKPFQCKSCNQRFTHLASLKSHVKSKHLRLVEQLLNNQKWHAVTLIHILTTRSWLKQQLIDFLYHSQEQGKKKTSECSTINSSTKIKCSLVMALNNEISWLEHRTKFTNWQLSSCSWKV